MTLILDTGPLVALADRGDRFQPEIERLLTRERGPLVIPASVTAEADHLLGRRLGQQARRAFLDDLAAGRFVVECLEQEDYSTVSDLEGAYAGLSPGLADLSLVLMARRFRTPRLLTFDERHFRAIRPLQGGAFVVLPADG